MLFKWFSFSGSYHVDLPVLPSVSGVRGSGLRLAGYADVHGSDYGCR